MSTDLATRSTVRELVAAFQTAEQDIRAAVAAIVAAEARVNAVFTLGGDYPIHVSADHGTFRDQFDDPDDCIERMARDAWRCIVERLELRRVMSIEAWAKLEHSLAKEKLPPITEANVHAFAEQYAASIPDMFAEAVREVFEWLTPQRGDYKTNDKATVGPRVVRTGVVERAWTGKGYRVNHYRQQSLTALERVFQGLDGNGMASKGYYSALETAINESTDGRAETDYFEVRAHKNGNLHIRFKRLDLLAKLNAMAGGARLRPAA